jgi:gliding motility-associated-like protein
VNTGLKSENNISPATCSEHKSLNANSFRWSIVLLSFLILSSAQLSARIGCSLSSSLPVPVIAGSDTTICSFDSVQLSASGALTYVWSPAAGLNDDSTANPIAFPSSTTTYIVTGFDSIGVVGRDTLTVFVNPRPVAAFTSTFSNNHFFLQSGGSDPVCFTDNAVGATNWNWILNNESSSDQSPCFTVTDTGFYCVQQWVMGNGGCQDSASLCFRVINSASYTIPNVFTPNGDGMNDAFYITSSGIKALNCEIYDRWGVRLAAWTTINGSWDGRTTSGEMVSNGIYYYVITITDFNDTMTEEKGFTQLQR